jgi:hypothetical protein
VHLIKETVSVTGKISSSGGLLCARRGLEKGRLYTFRMPQEECCQLLIENSATAEKKFVLEFPKTREDKRNKKKFQMFNPFSALFLRNPPKNSAATFFFPFLFNPF